MIIEIKQTQGEVKITDSKDQVVLSYKLDGLSMKIDAIKLLDSLKEVVAQLEQKL